MQEPTSRPLAPPHAPDPRWLDPSAELDADGLEAAIRFHDERYFRDHAPVIPDQHYDRLVERLRALRPESPVLGQVASDLPTDGAVVGHHPPMLSLGKCYDSKVFARWLATGDGALVASPKVDGVALALRYDGSGTLVGAATRGDGSRGEDVLHHARRVCNIPSQLVRAAAGVGDGPLEVRGECYLPLSTFAAVEELFANPRNAAAGVLKAKDDPGIPPERLAFFAYDLLGAEVTSEVAKAEALAALGFAPAPWERCDGQGFASVVAAWEARRPSLDFEIDGVVFKFDALDLQRRLGATAHHPRWAIAWKFQGDSGETRLLEVAWSLSRTGTITPVAQVEPVVLSGATVTRATLHNLSTVERLRLRRGDRLLLTRRGGVIPHVEASIGGGDEAVAPPAACPGCGGPTEVHETTRKVAGAALTTRTLHCAAPETCPPVLRGQLVHFATTLEIDGFGPKVVDALVEQGLVRDEADLFALDEATMLRLPRMGPTLARRLLSQRDARREVTLATLLVALGVESLGRQTADLLASRWSLAELRAVSEDAIADLHSLDTLTAARIVTGLRAAGPRLDRLLHEVRVTQGAATQAGVLAGHTVVFTGRLEQMGRRDAQQWVTRRGGIAGASVTAETTLLVVGGDELSAATPSSKLVKARKLSTATGLEIVDEPTFFSRFGGSDA